MVNLFVRRHKQYVNLISTGQACTPNPANCPTLGLDRCVRELVILEMRAVAKEFLNEARQLSVLTNTYSFPQDPNIAPVELAAAKIFDLHLGSPTPAAQCSTASVYTSDPASCLGTGRTAGLQKQIDLSPSPASALIESSSTLVKTLGLGSINAYLRLLGIPEISYASQKSNLLIDVANKAAFAFNLELSRTFSPKIRETPALPARALTLCPSLSLAATSETFSTRS
jgi:hypothetical protein